jgi:hypothetical protein
MQSYYLVLIYLWFFFQAVSRHAKVSICYTILLKNEFKNIRLCRNAFVCLKCASIMEKTIENNVLTSVQSIRLI